MDSTQIEKVSLFYEGELGSARVVHVRAARGSRDRHVVQRQLAAGTGSNGQQKAAVVGWSTSTHLTKSGGYMVTASLPDGL